MNILINIRSPIIFKLIFLFSKFLPQSHNRCRANRGLSSFHRITSSIHLTLIERHRALVSRPGFFWIIKLDLIYRWLTSCSCVLALYRKRPILNLSFCKVSALFYLWGLHQIGKNIYILFNAVFIFKRHLGRDFSLAILISIEIRLFVTWGGVQKLV
jgi:hypothetical protein